MITMNLPVTKGVTLRLGKRAIVASKDKCVRSYRVNRLLDFHAGVKRGHVEILVLRRWRVLLQAA